MLKKMLVVSLCAIMFCVGCESRNEIAVWAGTGNDLTSARVGYMVDENIEVGASSNWWPSNAPDIPQSFGLYACYYFDEVVDFNNPVPVDFLPKTFKGQPYIGGQFGLNIDGDGELNNLNAGILWNKIFFTETQYRWFENTLEDFRGADDPKVRLVAGVRIKF